MLRQVVCDDSSCELHEDAAFVQHIASHNVHKDEQLANSLLQDKKTADPVTLGLIGAKLIAMIKVGREAKAHYETAMEAKGYVDEAISYMRASVTELEALNVEGGPEDSMKPSDRSRLGKLVEGASAAMGALKEGDAPMGDRLTKALAVLKATQAKNGPVGQPQAMTTTYYPRRRRTEESNPKQAPWDGPEDPMAEIYGSWTDKGNNLIIHGKRPCNGWTPPIPGAKWTRHDRSMGEGCTPGTAPAVTNEIKSLTFNIKDMTPSRFTITETMRKNRFFEGGYRPGWQGRFSEDDKQIIWKDPDGHEHVWSKEPVNDDEPWLQPGEKDIKDIPPGKRQ